MPDTALESVISQFVLERACLLVFVTDRHGYILQANQYAKDFTGHELTGENLSDVIIDFAGNFTVESAIEEPASRMWSVSTTNGIAKTFNFHFVDQGEEIVLFGEHNHRDSEFLEESLISLNRDIANMNRDLQKRAAQLEQLHEEKNRFMGMASHDLRNPIGSIYNLSESLYESASASYTDEELEILSAIHESSGFMLSLIDDLLNVATIESGKVQLNYESTDLTELIATFVKLNRPAADKKSIELKVHTSDALAALPVDRMKMQQVLNNLISNAVKFSEPHTAVTISVREDGDNARVSVADQGRGIPEADIETLFAPFSRTGTKATDGEKSTGLGLFIVKRIIEEHKGKIWVDTAEGEGTVFNILLPLSQTQHTKGTHA